MAKSTSSKKYQHPKLASVTLPFAMQALADPCRLAIVRQMLQQPEHEFACNEFDLEPGKATVSHHFETLREAGIIESRVEGRKCLSALRLEEFEERFPGLIELVRSA